jgi:hypothetical protein
MSAAYVYCICTTASAKAINSLLEGSGEGSMTLNEPWAVASEMLAEAALEERRVPLLLASGEPLQFTHWAWIKRIDVVELHRGSFETRCEFGHLEPVNPIFAEIDSMLLRPPEYQLRRESLESVRQHRHALTVAELHPYALCETPGFLLEATTA